MQLKTIQNKCFRQKLREATKFGVEGVNSKAQVKEKLGHMAQIHICRLPLTWQLSSVKKEEKRLCSNKNCKESIAMKLKITGCPLCKFSGFKDLLITQGPKQIERE